MSNSPLPSSTSTSNPSWLKLLALDLAITFGTLLLFGVCGGLFLLIALNGFSESEATPVFVIYIVIACGFNFLASYLANRWLLRKRPQPAASIMQTAWLPAALATAGLMGLGPMLAFTLIRFFFGA